MTQDALGHRNGRLHNMETGPNYPTENTMHLQAAFIDSAPDNPWDVQVAFDDACTACHASYGIMEMRHDRDGLPVPNAAEFGTHLTVPDGETIPWPVDSDLSTYASRTGPNYATCVSCHDPHGTGIVETGSSSNYMLRAKWRSSSALCDTCHVE